LNVALLPADVTQVAELIEAGIDGVGFGLDAACERVFREVKGMHWDHMLSIIGTVAERFPQIGSVHLIVGLGETEREMVERMLWVRDLGLRVGLFAFTPVQGTVLADRLQPPLSQYRRMQVARWLILHHGARMTSFGFGRTGVLTRINLAGWRDALAGGEAFRTSGCPACNRPFYNERPGGTIYNYARPLTAEEAEQALLDTEVEV
jgi:biotin synthase